MDDVEEEVGERERKGGEEDESETCLRGVLSRNVVRNGVRGALATRHAVRAREGVTFLRLAVVVVVHVVIRVVIVV